MDTEQRQIIMPNLPPRQAAIMALTELGYKNGEIARALGIHNTYPSQIKAKLKKYDITSNKYIKLAATAHEMILQAVVDPIKLGQEGRTLPFVLKGSDVAAAIDRTMDRVQPIVHKVEQSNINLNIEFDVAGFEARCRRDAP